MKTTHSAALMMLQPGDVIVSRITNPSHVTSHARTHLLHGIMGLPIHVVSVPGYNNLISNKIYTDVTVSFVNTKLHHKKLNANGI